MSYQDKLAKVEALLQRASSEGERQAAELAKFVLNMRVVCFDFY